MSPNPRATWSLPEWLDYLENRHKPEVQLRLVNALLVAKSMNLLTWSVPVIIVGGTNGKGSTVAALAAIYETAGYRVGTFTSPHVLAFNERICINQQSIADNDLCEALLTVENERCETPLSYFEMSFLAALWYFKRAALDVLILEVGVGGRLDATNIIDADLAIITTVDLDHQDYLGHDKEAIGAEKAGILRHQQPFIYADFDPPASVVAKAQALQTDMACLGKTYHYQLNQDELCIIRDDHPMLVLPKPNIHANAAVAAVLATERLQKRLPVTFENWVAAMQNVTIMARRHWVEGPITFLWDVAHNPQAARLLAHTITQHKPSGKVHVVFSALQDKDICGLISPLSTIVDQWYPTCLTGKRAAPREMILAAFEKVFATEPMCYSEPILACDAAIAAAVPGDLIVVYGSFVLVGAIYQRYNGVS